MGGWLAPRFQARCILFCMIVWAGGSSLEVAAGAAGSRAPRAALVVFKPRSSLYIIYGFG